ncbi:MAG: hypothetical protein QM756_03760 [Polyangiaceae bacterium]
MTESEPLRLRHERDTERELALALRELPGERPSDAAIGALRARLSAQVGEPVRLRRTEPELARALHADAPNAEQLRALRAKLPEAAPSRASARKIQPRRLTLSTLAWLLPAAAAAMAGGYLATRSGDEVAPMPSHNAVQPPPAPTPATSAPIEMPSAPTASASAPAPKPAVAPTANRADPEAELALMREAQAALGSDPARALALTKQHAQKYPRGVLAQEREVVAIDALKRLGQNGEAAARAARFRQSHPESAYLPRIERLVGSAALPKPAAPASSDSSSH